MPPKEPMERLELVVQQYTKLVNMMEVKKVDSESIHPAETPSSGNNKDSIEKARADGSSSKKPPQLITPNSDSQYIHPMVIGDTLEKAGNVNANNMRPPPQQLIIPELNHSFQFEREDHKQRIARIRAALRESVRYMKKVRAEKECLQQNYERLEKQAEYYRSMFCNHIFDSGY